MSTYGNTMKNRYNHNMNTITIYMDEAGRGPIAGPVTVGLVVDSHDVNWSIYHDSKLLTAIQRARLADHIIQDPSIIYVTGSASAKEIDRNGIIRGLRRATIRGLYHLTKQILAHGKYITPELFNQSIGKQCYKQLLLQYIETITTHLGPIHLIIDGNHTFGLDEELGIAVTTIIKGDRIIPQIGAASIIAKVTRDQEMIKLSEQYPHYGFEQHMGYGTPKHYEAVRLQGLCEIHRKKWIR